MMEIKTAIDLVKKSHPYAVKYKGVEEDEALQTLVAFCEKIQYAEMPKKYEDIEKSKTNEEIKEYMRGYNQCHDEFLTYHLRKISEKVDVERVWQVICKFLKPEQVVFDTRELAQAIASTIGKRLATKEKET